MGLYMAAKGAGVNGWATPRGVLSGDAGAMELAMTASGSITPGAG